MFSGWGNGFFLVLILLDILNFLSVLSFIQRDIFVPRNIQSEGNDNWCIGYFENLTCLVRTMPRIQ